MSDNFGSPRRAISSRWGVSLLQPESNVSPLPGCFGAINFGSQIAPTVNSADGVDITVKCIRARQARLIAGYWLYGYNYRPHCRQL
jgi:hypothetical protein